MHPNYWLTGICSGCLLQHEPDCSDSLTHVLGSLESDLLALAIARQADLAVRLGIRRVEEGGKIFRNQQSVLHVCWD